MFWGFLLFFALIKVKNTSMTITEFFLHFAQEYMSHMLGSQDQIEKREISLPFLLTVMGTR